MTENTIMSNEEALNRIKNMMREQNDFLETRNTYALSMAYEALEKQIPKPPIPDENATDRFGKPVPRCQVCGYALDLQIEQYCPCCGQRLTEYEVEE